MRRATAARASWRLQHRSPRRAASCSLFPKRCGRLVRELLLAGASWAGNATHEAFSTPVQSHLSYIRMGSLCRRDLGLFCGASWLVLDDLTKAFTTYSDGTSLRQACRLQLLMAMLLMQDVLHKQLERASSQAEQECQAILGAAGASRGRPAPLMRLRPPTPPRLPRKHQRTAGPEAGTPARSTAGDS